MQTSLDALFNASSVAIIGASNNPRKASHQVILTMLTEGYTGNLYPVNPNQSQVLGLKCFPTLSDIPQPVELLVISLPAKHVRSVVKEAVERDDIRGVIILSAGFAETAQAENVQLQSEIVSLCRQRDIRVIGPNCIGLINSKNALCTSFAPGLKFKEGGISFITQSGAFGGAFLMLLGDQPEVLGFNKFAHVGNMADVSNIEVLRFYGQDPTTTVIGMYMEGVQNGRALLDCARQISSQKPIFALKVSKTEIGSRAAMSHTGTLAGSDRIYDAAFKQSGIVRVQTMDEPMDACKAASMYSRPRGERVCILTEAGGPGIIAMDEIGSQSHLKLANLQPQTCDQLKALLPKMAVVSKPNGYIDMTAAAMENEHANALKLVLEDPDVDMVILISVPPTYLPALDVAKAVADIIRAYNKPVAVCLMRGEAMNPARKYLEHQQIATFDTPDRAAKALIHLSAAAKHLEILKSN